MRKLWVRTVKSVETDLEHGEPQDYPQSRNGNNKSFLSGLRHVVFIGRCLGLVSRSDVLSKTENQKTFTIPLLISGLLATFLLINAVLLIRCNLVRYYRMPTISEKLGELSLPGYASTMFFDYAYLLFATKRFRNIVQNICTANIKFATPFTNKFRRFCWRTTITCLVLGISENLLFDVQNLKRALLEKEKYNSILEFFYKETYYYWTDYIPYHPVLTVIYILVEKCGTWGWVYGDVIAIVLARAIAEKFKALNCKIQQIIDTNNTSTKMDERTLKVIWDGVQDEFLMLMDITLEIQQFIAPLIFACYGYNMHIIMISLFYWIAPYSEFTLEQSFYVYYAFFQFLFRVAIVTYFAADVHHVSFALLDTIQHCPNSLYNFSLQRIERALVNNPIGICLFGSFMITRNFFLSIISFLFTTEIVLLQTTGTRHQ